MLDVPFNVSWIVVDAVDPEVELSVTDGVPTIENVAGTALDTPPPGGAAVDLFILLAATTSAERNRAKATTTKATFELRTPAFIVIV